MPGALGSPEQEASEFGDRADLTYANEWSFSTNLAYASPVDTAYTIMKNEIHDGVVSKGILDETGKNIMSGTENLTSIDDRYVTFLIPRETMFMQVASFNTATEDLPPEQILCDVAPSEAGAVITIPSHP